MRNTFAAWLLVCCVFSAQAENLDKARLLVASPQLEGVYSRTAVLVVPMRGVHVGFILNRATELKLATMFPHHPPSAKVVDPVYFGGPERIDAIFAVVRRHPGGASAALFDDLFLTVSAQVVDRIIEQTPNDARYFAGFVGWRPGELAKEIEAGYWFVSDPDASVVFSKDSHGMWEELVQRLGNGHAPAKGPRL